MVEFFRKGGEKQTGSIATARVSALLKDKETVFNSNPISGSSRILFKNFL